MLWQLQASDLTGQKQVQEGSCQPAVPLIYLEYFPSDFCIDSLEVMKQHILTTNMSTVIGSSPSLFRVFSSWNKKKGKTKIYHLEKESRFQHRAFPYFMLQWWLFILDEAKDSNTADVTTCSSNLLSVRYMMIVAVTLAAAVLHALQWKSPADPFEPEVLLWHTAAARAGFPPAHAAPVYQLQLLTLLKLLISPLLLFSHIKPALKFSKTLRAHPQLTWSQLAQWMALDSEHCEVWGLKMERPQTLLFCTKIHIRQLIKCI